MKHIQKRYEENTKEVVKRACYILPLRSSLYTSFVFALYLISCCSIPLFSHATGTPTAQFLEFMPNARGAALGGAYTALVDDASSMAWNPAGLAAISHGSVHAMYHQHVQSIVYQYLAGGLAVPGWGGLGVQALALNSGDMIETFEDSTGAYWSRNTVFQVADVALGAGWGFELQPGLRVGAGAKWFQQQIATVTKASWAFDAGFQWALIPALRLGGSLLNVGAMVDGEPLPTVWRVGAAIDLMPEALIVGEVSQTVDAPVAYSVGVEYSLLSLLALRGGYQTGLGTGGNSGLTAGFGLFGTGFSLDYAFAPLGDLGSSHRVSATLKY